MDGDGEPTPDQRSFVGGHEILVVLGNEAYYFVIVASYNSSSHCFTLYAAMSISDSDDVALFRFLHPDDLDDILCIKHNHPHTTDVALPVLNLDVTALERLSNILRDNTTLQRLVVVGNSSRSVAELYWVCKGIEENETIKDLTLNQTNVNEQSIHLFSNFIKNCPTLERLSFYDCMIVQGGINAVSESMMQRSVHSLVELNMQRAIGNSPDVIVTALESYEA